MIRYEYPRPDIVRKNWWPLNGQWNFTFDDENRGISDKWFLHPNFPLKIEVPFAFQTKLSGINDPSFHDYIWYHRVINVPKRSGHRYLLHFQAVDYECQIFIDGNKIGTHTGGQAPFSFDVTDSIITDSNHDLVVYVFDPSTDLFLPRGKQYWKPQSESIWYTRTSGIWQSVWIEEVPDAYVTSIRLTPKFDQGQIMVALTLSSPNRLLEIEISDHGKLVASKMENATQNELVLSFNVFQHEDDWKHKAWTPERPYLFDVKITYGYDELITYFGMRKVATNNGRLMLNNEPYYPKMVLDQGYWPDGLLTAPSADDLAKDIVLAKEMGFNGARKHQKCEDPYFAYHADHLGFLVWGEMASCVLFSELSAKRDLNEWQQIIPRDYNHPSIIAWVPLNESWGVPNIRSDVRQQQHAIDLYDYIKSVDDTRLVIGNDGWEMVKTDICAVHHYRHGARDDIAMQQKYKHELANQANILKSQPADRPLYADGYSYQGEPILLTEFGGISYVVSNQGWGYTNVNNGHDLLDEYRRLIAAINSSSAIAGFCYTQLTDVEYEVNGLLTYDRQPKMPLASIKEINDLIKK